MSHHPLEYETPRRGRLNLLRFKEPSWLERHSLYAAIPMLIVFVAAFAAIHLTRHEWHEIGMATFFSTLIWGPYGVLSSTVNLAKGAATYDVGPRLALWIYLFVTAGVVLTLVFPNLLGPLNYASIG